MKITSFPNEFRPKFNNNNRKSGGHSNIGLLKLKSGMKAEEFVSNFLKLNNIPNDIMSGSNSSHMYDIQIKDLTNLEVKNISNNKSFYLSETQISNIINGTTRLCLVNFNKGKNVIYISKNTNYTNVLNKIFKDYIELKDYTLKKYNGRFRIDSLEIGIIKPDDNFIEDLYKDFVTINQMTRSQIINFLSDKQQ